MSYREPTPHEISISKCLHDVAKAAEKSLNELSGGECAFFIWATPRETVSGEPVPILDAPVSNYVSNMEREGAALTMLELLAKWETNQTIPPLHELKDANGRTLAEILGAGPH